MPKGRWGYVVFINSTQPNAGAWVRVRRGKRTDKFYPVQYVGSATVYRTKAKADGVAVLVAASYPHVIGRLEVRRYDSHVIGRLEVRRYDSHDTILRGHDFTVNHNG